MDQFIIDVQAIARSLILVYRHFVHWTVTRTLIILSMLGLALVVSIPAIALIAYSVYYFLPFWQGIIPLTSIIMTLGTTGDKTMLLFTMGPMLWVFIGLFLLLVVACILLPYGGALTVRICRAYLDGETVSFQELPCLSWQYISRYIGILAWSLLYYLRAFLYTIVCAIAGIIIVSIGAWVVESYVKTGDTILLAVAGWAVVGALAFIPIVVVFLRTGFASFILMSDPEDGLRSGHDYVRESWERTRGKMLSIALVFFLFTGVVYIISYACMKAMIPFWTGFSSLRPAVDALGVYNVTLRFGGYQLLMYLLLGGLGDMFFAAVGRQMLGIGDDPETIV